MAAMTTKHAPTSDPTPDTIQAPLPDWADFRHRVWRAAYTAAAHAIGATVSADLLTGAQWNMDELAHAAIAIGVAVLSAVLTAVKSLIAQGRGTNPADGSLR